MTKFALLLWLCLLAGVAGSGRSVRYVEFSPPVVFPQQEVVTVQARQDYTISCQGHKPLAWHLPRQASNINNR